ncbi:MAG: hypothetical protein ACKOEL_03040 [Planctomycetota bacterium]
MWSPRQASIACAALAGAVALVGCAGKPMDPLAALSGAGSPGQQESAIDELSARGTLDDDAKRTLRRVMVAPGFSLAVRQGAFDLLVKDDRDGLRTTLETNIVRMESLEFRRWLLVHIAARDMKDFTTVAVNSWAGPVPVWGPDERKRPEFLALAGLYGEDRVADALFAVMNDASPVTKAALRARTWELLMRIGERDRLKALVTDAAIRPDDAMLRDIKQLVAELGILPETREELLWLSKLRQSASPAFWKLAGDALREVPEEDKRRFELRGIPVAIAAHRYAPELLKLGRQQLYDQLLASLKARDAFKHSPNFEGWDTGSKRTENLAMQRDEVRWIDLLAASMAVRMIDDSAVRARLFDIADRDQQDRRTEYGGVVRISDTGAWEVVEVRPRTTGSDVRFEAPQELFDQGYTALFHFHMHAQEFENGSYAGPHMGDFAYAGATRANCLVFTFVRRDRMNADFYRHGPVVIDLGTVARP